MNWFRTALGGGFSMYRRPLTGALVALLITFSQTGVAAATTATISPSSQSHAHGVASHWTTSWSGQTPIRQVCFAYDVNNSSEGGWCLFTTSSTSRSDSHTYWPCTTKTFTQALEVYDWNYVRAYRTSNATEAGGACR
jgi:hypothetical protein